MTKTVKKTPDKTPDKPKSQTSPPYNSRSKSNIQKRNTNLTKSGSNLNTNISTSLKTNESGDSSRYPKLPPRSGPYTSAGTNSNANNRGNLANRNAYNRGNLANRNAYNRGNLANRNATNIRNAPYNRNANFNKSASTRNANYNRRGGIRAAKGRAPIMTSSDSILSQPSVLYKRQLITAFLECIPIKIGTQIIGGLGVFYGFIGLFFFMDICIHFQTYKTLYVDRFDVLMYLFFLFFSLIIVFVASIVLLVAVNKHASDSKQHNRLFWIYLWSVVGHIVIIWLMNLIVFFYCLFDQTCFCFGGPSHAVCTIILNVYYNIIWIYTMLTVNSYRLEVMYE